MKTIAQEGREERRELGGSPAQTDIATNAAAEISVRLKRLQLVLKMMDRIVTDGSAGETALEEIGLLIDLAGETTDGACNLADTIERSLFALRGAKAIAA